MGAASSPPLRMDLCWWSIVALVQLLPIQGLEKGEQLRRVRRRWVWNQFYVLEEYAGPQPLYVGKLHSDLDSGDGSVEYMVSGEGAGTVFTVDGSTGDLHALRKLDRETKAQYVLRARALHRHTGLPLEPDSQFTIRIQDVNDNEPKFLDGPYQATVPEMSALGTSVIRVTATDADDPAYGSSAMVAYSLLQGEPYFTVEARTGILRVSRPDMDREQQAIYHLVVQAKDMAGQQGGLASTTTVTVTLSDVNDSPPRFSQELYQLSVPELAAEGTVVGYIRADDPDEGANADMVYRLVGGDAEDTFAISTDPTNRFGIITVKKDLDFEARQSYTLRVEAANTQPDPRFLGLGPFSDVTSVRVSVEDVDEPPRFCAPFYYLEVPEDVEPGTELETLSAMDPDMANDSIRYSIERLSDPERFFYIDSFSGSLITERPLDREQYVWQNITVLAMEMNNPSQMGSVSVAIKVLNVNDNPPRLEQCDVFVCDNAKTGQLIYTVRAIDEDDPHGAQPLYYSLEAEDTNNSYFFLRDNQDNTAGVLVLREGFSVKDQTTYHLSILIRDGVSPSQTGTSTLTVRVCRCDARGDVLSCTAEPQPLTSGGLSRGALLAILACTLLSLVAVLLIVSLRSRGRRYYPRDEELTAHENIVHYDDEGGGEVDTVAFDLATMWIIKDSRGETKGRRGFLRDSLLAKLQEANTDQWRPPYDSLQTYTYEGEDSRAGSLSPLVASPSNASQDYSYLREWGPQFEKLALIYGVLGRKDPSW
ncbi:cadherin-20-like [Paramormyrops kingsleyae]|uniref:Cadherin-20 n=1 Tax=Paramormyrops kingsleyae TaxID=1676925 RepID=A0A3B3T309_9TELE|nr:cadherin-20-like [Paramormyrops kingsleyae]